MNSRQCSATIAVTVITLIPSAESWRQPWLYRRDLLFPLWAMLCSEVLMQWVQYLEMLRSLMGFYLPIICNSNNSRVITIIITNIIYHPPFWALYMHLLISSSQRLCEVASITTTPCYRWENRGTNQWRIAGSRQGEKVGLEHDCGTCILNSHAILIHMCMCQLVEA